MPALNEVAAYIIDGVVVNVGALSTENDYTAAHAALADKFDEIRIVPAAGIGWTVEKDGLRPPAPYPSWVWDGEGWQAPVEYPSDGNTYTWDEDTVSWVEVV